MKQVNLNLDCFDVESIESLIKTVKSSAKGASVFERNNILHVFYDENNFTEYTIEVNKVGEYVLKVYRRVVDSGFEAAQKIDLYK